MFWVRRTRIRPPDRRICISLQTLRVPAVYPDLEPRSCPVLWPLRARAWSPGEASVAGSDGPQGPAAYLAVIRGRRSDPDHGGNIRSAGHGGQRPVVGQEGRAARAEGRGQLERVRGADAGRRPELGGGAEERPVELHQVQTAAAGQQRLVALGEREIARAVRHDQGLEQGDPRGHRLPAAAVEAAKTGSTSGRNRGCSWT
jgi:hypothetical protein